MKTASKIAVLVPLCLDCGLQAQNTGHAAAGSAGTDLSSQ